jgi:ABC-type polar amino acid transport system ATPase subunit
MAAGLTDDPFVRVDRLEKRYGAQTVLSGVTFDVRSGEALVVCGPSGCGKSTLLRCLNGLEAIDGGEVFVDGVAIHQASADTLMRVRLSVGIVFQSFNLFPHMTALQNVTLAPIKILGHKRREAEAAGHELLARVGIPDKAQSYPYQLSGGQRQRVAIARALAMRPRLMLFDEPTSALDPEMREEVLDVIRRLKDEDRMTMVVVTHEVGFGRRVADRAMLMEAGRIVEMGEAASFFTSPREERTRRFLKAIVNA